MCVIFVIYFLLYYFRNNTTSPFVTIWHAFIIYIHSCYYICQGVFLHDPRCSKNWESLNFCLKKMSNCTFLPISENFGDLEKEFILFNLQRKNKKKWCIKHDIVLCTTIWGEYSNVYFLVIFFIYQVVALFSLANDSYILLFKNDSYKSKHFIGKTFFFMSVL